MFNNLKFILLVQAIVVFGVKSDNKSTFDAKGVGDINALGLITKQAKVRAMGVSIIRVSATDDVQIEVTGVSSVYYQLPKGKKPSIAVATGLGKIVPMS